MKRPPAVRLYDDELIVDSFAGGGGASTGIEWALGRSTRHRDQPQPRSHRHARRQSPDDAALLRRRVGRRSARSDAGQTGRPHVALAGLHLPNNPSMSFARRVLKIEVGPNAKLSARAVKRIADLDETF